MAQCGYCGTTILFGGVHDGDQRYCNQRCKDSGYILRLGQLVPPQEIERETEAIFHGNCPKCHGPGPIDVHKIHRVWSALILTSWSSPQQVSCRSCAVKSQLGAILFCATLGWWGFPWGILLTPIQIFRNIAGMASGRDGSRPSAELRKLVQVIIGAKMATTGRQTPPPLPPPVPQQLR